MYLHLGGCIATTVLLALAITYQAQARYRNRTGGAAICAHTAVFAILFWWAWLIGEWTVDLSALFWCAVMAAPVTVYGHIKLPRQPIHTTRSGECLPSRKHSQTRAPSPTR